MKKLADYLSTVSSIYDNAGIHAPRYIQLFADAVLSKLKKREEYHNCSYDTPTANLDITTVVGWHCTKLFEKCIELASMTGLQESDSTYLDGDADKLVSYCVEAMMCAYYG